MRALLATRTSILYSGNMKRKATLGGGCFWCVESVFRRLEGVLEVTSGYAGGRVENPSYEDVSRGDTGHAEVVQLDYDDDRISFEKILEIFWRAHDPTTQDRQGPDVGPQYRSIILYHDQEQRKAAEESIRELEEKGVYGDPIVTELVHFEAFYPAEEYHQRYFEKNPHAGYCSFIIRPKLKKLDLSE